MFSLKKVSVIRLFNGTAPVLSTVRLKWSWVECISLHIANKHKSCADVRLQDVSTHLLDFTHYYNVCILKYFHIFIIILSDYIMSCRVVKCRAMSCHVIQVPQPYNVMSCPILEEQRQVVIIIDTFLLLFHFELLT